MQESTIELKDKRSSLMNEVSKLSDTLNEMNKKVSIHQALSLNLETINKEILKKQSELKPLQKEVALLNTDKRSKLVDKAELDSINKKKVEVSEELSLMLSKVKVAQDELETFVNGLHDAKNSKIGELNKIQSDIDKLSTAKLNAIQSVEAVINSIK